MGELRIQAHSFPPSSLDRRFTELIASPKKVVGCRGGSRNVEGCWGTPYLKIKKTQFLNFQFYKFPTFKLSNYNFQFPNFQFLNSPKNTKSNIFIILIDMKFISKVLWILLMEIDYFPFLIFVKSDLQIIYSKII